MKLSYFERIFLVISVLALSSCQKNTEPEVPEYYLQKWYGTYKGTSHQWKSIYVNNAWDTTHWYKDILIEVQKGDLDSTLTFDFLYNDTVLGLSKNLKFKEDGTHYSFVPGGSNGSTLNVAFYSDTLLDYKYWQMLGIPNTFQEEFIITKE